MLLTEARLLSLAERELEEAFDFYSAERPALGHRRRRSSQAQAHLLDPPRSGAAVNEQGSVALIPARAPRRGARAAHARH
jgi:hypothetical protein